MAEITIRRQVKMVSDMIYHGLKMKKIMKCGNCDGKFHLCFI